MAAPELGPLANIPSPPGSLLLGHLKLIDPLAAVSSLVRIVDKWPELNKEGIFLLRIGPTVAVLVTKRTLMDELCNEARFLKRTSTKKEHRLLGGDGLFIADTLEPIWGKAHRILMPAFGPNAIRGMFPDMRDIAAQLVQRWERMGPSATLDVVDDYTRLALDTIALCGFGTRYNSFYREKTHPFVELMVEALRMSGWRKRMPPAVVKAAVLKDRKFRQICGQMHEIVLDIVRQRKADPEAGKYSDLLSKMLCGKDPVDGSHLSDDNIMYQCITFLIAGHETTSGMLSFATYLLMANPGVLAKAHSVVDDVLGAPPPAGAVSHITLEHIGKLEYIECVLMEALRLYPPAGGVTVTAKEDTVIGGKYRIPKGQAVTSLLYSLHRDPEAWEEPEAFRPERFMRENADKLKRNAWKPFGNGSRACIGRPFAMQEATLALSMVLHMFDFTAMFDNERKPYTMRLSEALTIKPGDFYMRMKRRVGTGAASAGAPAAVPSAMAAAAPVEDDGTPKAPLLVLFGGNSGSCEAFAQQLAAVAPAHGYRARVAAMDEMADHQELQVPAGATVVLIAASYEGEPADNAREFMAALGASLGQPASGAGAAAGPQLAPGVKYCVFGCGNRQWSRTYMRIPRLLDEQLEKAGAARVYARGEADSSGDFAGAFESWAEGLWAGLDKALGRETRAPVSTGPTLTAETVTGARAVALKAVGADELLDALVEANVELAKAVTEPGVPFASKRHITFLLPEGASYKAGDYVAILPRNSAEAVDRVMGRFGLPEDAQVKLTSRTDTFLPIGVPVNVDTLLTDYVELGQVATKSQVAALAAATPEADAAADKASLAALAGAGYESGVLAKRLSVLELLEAYPTARLGFAAFLAMLPPLKPRQYSISSSPMADPRRCTITMGVLSEPHLAGEGRVYKGVCSNYLAAATPGKHILLSVRPASAHFRLPEDPATPLVLIAAGTGIAPMRAFLQERSAKAAMGVPVGKSLLFYGCQHPEADYLHREELERWAAQGIVELRPVFSRVKSEAAKAAAAAAGALPDPAIRYVQDRMVADAGDVDAVNSAGGQFLMCGDAARLATGVRDALAKIRQKTAPAAVSDAEARSYVEVMEREHHRLAVDVF